MADRNQQAKNDFAIATARRQFLQALQAGQTGLYDDIGALIKPGQLAIFDAPPNVWRWLVQEVVPDLRANAQPGAMRLVLTVQVPLYLMAGMRIPSLLVVGEQEAQPAQQQPAQPATETIGDGSAAGAPSAVPSDEAGQEDDAGKQPAIRLTDRD